jgi:CheY-like chemotaxis protein/anti-sigma regulatory factor (Ser/Thr protein kinase)
MGHAETILVIDDEEANQEILAEYLQAEGFETLTAVNGEEGLELFKKHAHIDAIVLDRMMPVMDGMEFIERYRELQEKDRYIPIIMQTAMADNSSICEGISAGVFYYLTKPYTRQILLSIIRSAIDEKHQREYINSELAKTKTSIKYLNEGSFIYRTMDQAQEIACFLAPAFSDADRVILGLSELLLNAVEHGSLEFGHQRKKENLLNGLHADEITHRASTAPYKDRYVEVSLRRTEKEVILSIKDQGPGFNASEYLEANPSSIIAPNGRGVLMARMMSFDEMEYTEGGTRVTVKNFV